MTVRILPQLRAKPAVYRNSLYRDTKTDEETRFYSSSAWRRASKAHRQLEPLCRECFTNGRTQLGDLTDHIRPLRNGGAPFDDANLQTLCDACHQAKRQQEQQDSK